MTTAAACSTVSFGETTFIPLELSCLVSDLNEPELYSRLKRKWYTESELVILEIENRRECNRGVSRGLELIHDEIFGQKIEAYQRNHTRKVLGQQRQLDGEALRDFSLSISHASAVQAMERARKDREEVAGVKTFFDLANGTSVASSSRVSNHYDSSNNSNNNNSLGALKSLAVSRSMALQSRYRNTGAAA